MSEQIFEQGRLEQSPEQHLAKRVYGYDSKLLRARREGLARMRGRAERHGEQFTDPRLKRIEDLKVKLADEINRAHLTEEVLNEIGKALADGDEIRARELDTFGFIMHDDEAGDSAEPIDDEQL